METAFLGLIALTLGAGACGGLLVAWSIHRRTRILEYAVSDVEERLLTVKNREKAEKRWNKEQTIEDELRALTTAAPARSARKFANDPVEPMD